MKFVVYGIANRGSTLNQNGKMEEKEGRKMDWLWVENLNWQSPNSISDDRTVCLVCPACQKKHPETGKHRKGEKIHKVNESKVAKGQTVFAQFAEFRHRHTVMTV